MRGTLRAAALVGLAVLVARCAGPPAHARELACPPGTTLRSDALHAECVDAGGDAEGPFHALHPNGRLRYQGRAAAGRVEGEWLGWHANGTRSLEAEYRGGELVGRFRMWDEHDRLLYEGHHDEAGQMDGTWSRWWPDGGLRLRWAMRNGRQHGRVEAWYPSGARRMRGERRDGVAHGRWTHWREDGSVACACRYESGRALDQGCDPAAASRCAALPDEPPAPPLPPLPAPGIR